MHQIFIISILSLLFYPFYDALRLSRSISKMENNNLLTSKSFSPIKIKTSVSVKMSTVISPPKKGISKDKKNDIKTDDSIGIFKENRDVQKEFENFDNENFLVILYNDPINKRIYVATCLMEIFEFTEEVAADIMMQAHTYGFAAVGEWNKDTAEDYCKQLLEKGLIATVVSSKSNDDSNEE